MFRRRLTPIALLLALAACGGDGPSAPVGARPFAACGDATPYVPTNGWRSLCPPSLGMDSARLRLAVQEIEGQMPTMLAFVVARRGYVALEAYWRGTRASTPLDLRSVTKAVTASVVASEIRRGEIPGLDAPLADYWPQYLLPPDDPLKAQLRVRHLVDLTAGFLMNSQGTTSVDYPGWTLTRPLAEAPGTVWQYDEPLYHLLSYLVRQVDSRGLAGAARDEVFAPLGIAGAAARWPADQWGYAHGAAGLLLTAREMLSVGELHRRDGEWDGAQVLPVGWVAQMRVRPDGLTPSQQLWTRGWRQVVLAGHLTLFTYGYGGQMIAFVPDLELVVVAAADPTAPQSLFPPVLSLVRDHVIPASEMVLE